MKHINGAKAQSNALNKKISEFRFFIERNSLFSYLYNLFIYPYYMKSFLLLFIICCNILTCLAQEDHSNYLFSEFSDSYIYYKDGRVFQVRSNYDLLKNMFKFIDKDNEIKEFADPDMIVSIKVGERTFILVDDNEAAEIVQADPRILVQYYGQKRVKKDLTFGGKTETASVDSYSNMIYGAGEDGKNTVLVNIDYQFYIEKNKRLKRFSTEKQFLKIFPKHKAQLKQYIDGYKIDFNSIGGVTKLCNYALSLN